MNPIFQHWRKLLATLLAAVLVFASLATSRLTAGPAEDEGCGSWREDIELDGILGEYVDILSWNIQKTSNDGWQLDLARHGAGVHLAFLQEAALDAPLVETLDSTSHKSFAAGYTTASQATGVMTLSRGAPSISCNYQTLEPWLGTPKATGVTYHPVAGQEHPLLAVNLHAVNFAMGVKEYRDQINTIKSLVASHPGAIIVAGDLNTWSEQRQRVVDEFMAEHGLEPVTFIPDLRTRFFGRALDHVYIRGLAAEEAEVIEVDSSDHNPLRMRLRFSEWTD
ncbi:MAG: endonuclease/exonuclease/phosphatase family protein [Pseudomonadota bacterium]